MHLPALLHLLKPTLVHPTPLAWPATAPPLLPCTSAPGLPWFIPPMGPGLDLTPMACYSLPWFIPPMGPGLDLTPMGICSRDDCIPPAPPIALNPGNCELGSSVPRLLRAPSPGLAPSAPGCASRPEDMLPLAALDCWSDTPLSSSARKQTQAHRLQGYYFIVKTKSTIKTTN